MDVMLMRLICGILVAVTLVSVSFAGTLNFLEVDNDVVLFSTTAAKTGTSPTCVTSENANLWSVSLATDSGRAIYSLILTAMAKGDTVELNIDSAQDCGVRLDVERARKVNISIQQIVNSNSKTIGVYQGDGLTRVGTLIDIDEANSVWTYIGSEPTRSVKQVSFELPPRRTFYYTEENCQGMIFNNNVGLQSGGEGGLYLPEGNLVNNRIYRSRWHSSLEQCDSYSEDKVHANGTRSIVPYTDPICGINICVLKQD